MAVLGADVDDLDRLARRFEQEGTRVDASVAAITSAVRAVRWIGTDADRFRAEWSATHAPRGRAIAEMLREQARHVIAQAREQRLASDGESPAAPGAGGAPENALPVTPSPLPADRVARSEFVQLDGQLGVGPVQVRVYGSYLIEYLADGRIRVTEIEGEAAGVSADAGARVELDLGATEYRAGAMAGASALAGYQTGRTFEIPAGELDQLLVRLGMDKFGPPGIVAEGVDAGSDIADFLTPDSIFGQNLPADEINDFIDRYVDYDLPTPVREGLDLTVSGDAYGVLGLQDGSSGRLEAELGIEVGAFRESDGDLGVRYAQQGRGSGELDFPIGPLRDLFTPPSGSVEGSQAVELVFDDGGRPSAITIEQTYGTGEHQTMQSIRVDLDSTAIQDDALAIRDALTNPTPENLSRLGDIDVGQWAESAERVEAGLSVGGEDYGAGAGIGAIPGLADASGDIELEHRSVEYEYGGHR